MQVNVAFRHMDVSPAIQRYASDKLEHVVTKYVQGDGIDSNITFSVEKFWHIVNFTININGLTVKSSEKSEDMYSSIDLALEKVERQVRRYKSKIRNHRPASRQRNLTVQIVAAPLEAAMEDEAQDELETIDTEAVTPALTPEPFVAPFMKVDAAIMRLELSDDAFLVFTSEDSERVNILFRREDGDFGLIDVEPQQH